MFGSWKIRGDCAYDSVVLVGRGILALAVALAVVGARDATACTCVRTAAVNVIGPNKVDDAPLNSRVRIELSAMLLDTSAGERLLLRQHGGPEVPTTTLGPLPLSRIPALVELRPRAELLPSTRYEVVLTRPGRRPSAWVLATFETGTKSDVTAPELEPLGNVSVGGLPPPPPPPGKPSIVASSSCGGDTPHVVIDKVEAHDPKRAGAQMVYGVWLGDPMTGKMDLMQPPAGIFVAQPDGRLVIGASDSCMMDFPFPKAASVLLGIAALDEAGNASKPRTLRVALR